VVTGEVAGVVTGLEAGLILCHAAEWHEVAAHHRETLHLAHLAHLTTVGHLANQPTVGSHDTNSMVQSRWLVSIGVVLSATAAEERVVARLEVGLLDDRLAQQLKLYYSWEETHLEQ